jgi:haloalkane dehalogenase
MYRELIKNLTGYRRLALDQMGMGLSSRPGPDYGYTLAERIADFGLWIDSLSLTEPIHLIVHDWGGPVGLGWAGANPDRVATLTIMNTGLKIPKGYNLPWKLALFKRSLFLGRFFATDLNLFVHGVIRYGTQRPMSPAVRDGYLAPYRKAAHRRALSGFVFDIPLRNTHPSHAKLAEVYENFSRLSNKPTLYAWGLKDFVFSNGFLDDFTRDRPLADVLALPLAGHCLLEDEPEAILRSVSGLLEGGRFFPSLLAGAQLERP